MFVILISFIDFNNRRMIHLFEYINLINQVLTVFNFFLIDNFDSPGFMRKVISPRLIYSAKCSLAQYLEISIKILYQTNNVP